METDQITRLKEEIEVLRKELETRNKPEGTLDPRILEAVIANIGTGFVVSDTSGNIIYENDAALRMHDFRYEDEELNSLEEFRKTFRLEYPEGGIVPFEKWPLALALKGDYFRDYLVRMINPQSRSRKIRYISYNTVPIYDRHGTKKYIVITMTDLSDIRERTEQLHESELRYDSLFNNATLGMAHCRIIVDEQGNPIDYEILQVNDAYTRISGLSKKDVEGRFATRVFPGISKFSYDFIGKYARIAFEGGELNEEIFDERFNKYISLYAYSPKEGEFTSIFTDITPRKEMEDRLAGERELFESIFNNIPVMITIYDPELKDFRFNREFRHIMGWTESDFKGSDLMLLSYPDPVYREEVAEFMRSLQGWKELRPMAKDGTYIDSNWANIRLSSGLQIGIGIDIRQRKKSEEALRKNEQRLRSLFENVALGIVEVDTQNRIVELNQRICNILGYTREELLGKTIHDITYHEDKALSLETNRRINSGEAHIIDYEKRYVKKDATPIWVHVTISGVYNDKGEHIHSIGTVEDITLRRRADEALVRSESILKQAGMMASLGAWVIEYRDYDNINNNRLDWSDQVYRIFGYEPGSVKVTNDFFYENVHPDDRGKVREAVESAIRNHQSYTVEHRIIRKDGETRIVIENAEITFDSNGKPLRIIGAVQDITERKMAEQALVESEEKFRSLFESITEGVALHNVIYENNVPVDFCVLDTNTAFTNYFGLKPQDAGCVPAKAVYESIGLPVRNEYFDVADMRNPMKFESSILDTKKHFIVNVISPKKGQFATVFEDITEQKKNEMEIKQKNEELTRFIYTVSHDLKSPLVTIKSFTKYLEEDITTNDAEAQGRDLNYIRNAADKMGKLLDELLELSRIGRKEKPKSTILLSEIVKSATDLVAGRLKEKKIKVKTSGPEVMLYGHGQRFIQLYQNLLDNSAKFMGNQPEPVIEVGSYTDENNDIVLFVSDNGKGIDPRYHHKIFGLFEKMDVDTEGTGIGLALVKRIVEVHGGTIWFISEGEGKGTTFYFRLEGTTLIK